MPVNPVCAAPCAQQMRAKPKLDSVKWHARGVSLPDARGLGSQKTQQNPTTQLHKQRHDKFVLGADSLLFNLEARLHTFLFLSSAKFLDGTQLTERMLQLQSPAKLSLLLSLNAA